MTPAIKKYKDGMFLVENVRTIFENIVKPGETSDGKPRRSLTYLIPQDKEGTAVKKKLDYVIDAAIKEKWPNEKTRPRKLTLPIKDAADGDCREDGIPLAEKYPNSEGHWYIEASTLQEIGVAGPNGKALPDVALKSEIYAGVWVNLLIHTYTYQDKPKTGVSFGLDAVQKVKDDEKFGAGAVDPEDVFGALPGSEDDDPFGGDDAGDSKPDADPFAGESDDEPPF